MPSILSQAVTGKEGSLGPQRQMDRQMDRVCLESRVLHSGGSAGCRGEIGSSLAGTASA